MIAVNVRNIKIGEGIPKICVSILGHNLEEIQAEARELVKTPVDIVEWRADWYDHVENCESVIEGARRLRGILGDIPLLFTFRTKGEGGQREMSVREYVRLTVAAADCGYVDMVDVELFAGRSEVSRIIDVAHKVGVKVIVSSHDFDRTPDKAEMVQRLCEMQELGADIPKLAVMPKSKVDVLELLAATIEMTEEHTDTPVITMAMSRAGVITRMAGEVFGSALTFGAGVEASAPGQVDVPNLLNMLQVIHRFCGEKS